MHDLLNLLSIVGDQFQAIHTAMIVELARLDAGRVEYLVIARNAITGFHQLATIFPN